MAVTDLTGYTWVGNSSINVTDVGDNYYMIDFSTEGYNNCFAFHLDEDVEGLSYCYDNNYSNIIYAYNSAPGWYNNAYKTIVITGGTDATNATLIAWLEANGTLTAPAPQVSYPNSFQDVSLTDNNGYITLTINGVDFNLEKGSSGYEVELYGHYGLGEYVYVQINDDPTWYYAQLDGGGYGFKVLDTNIPNAYQKEEYYTIAIPNVYKIKIGTQGNPTSTDGPEYISANSTGDFVGLTFTSTGSSDPAYATGEITMTQDSTIEFYGDM